MCGLLSFQYVKRRFELNPVTSFLTDGNVECEVKELRRRTFTMLHADHRQYNELWYR
jgi:hypothetical protein